MAVTDPRGDAIEPGASAGRQELGGEDVSEGR
jgi:hypothetical protein